MTENKRKQLTMRSVHKVNLKQTLGPFFCFFILMKREALWVRSLKISREYSSYYSSYKLSKCGMANSIFRKFRAPQLEWG